MCNIYICKITYIYIYCETGTETVTPCSSYHSFPPKTLCQASGETLPRPPNEWHAATGYGIAPVWLSLLLLDVLISPKYQRGWIKGHGLCPSFPVLERTSNLSAKHFNSANNTNITFGVNTQKVGPPRRIWAPPWYQSNFRWCTGWVLWSKRLSTRTDTLRDLRPMEWDGHKKSQGPWVLGVINEYHIILY